MKQFIWTLTASIIFLSFSLLGAYIIKYIFSCTFIEAISIAALVAVVNLKSELLYKEHNK